MTAVTVELDDVRRLIMLAWPCAVLLTFGIGVAASLGGVDGPNLGAGGGPVIACDPNGVSRTYTTVGAKVTEVTVGGIADPGCEGQRLSLTLTDSGHAALSTGGPTMIDADADTADNTLMVTIAAQPDATAVAGIHIMIETP